MPDFPEDDMGDEGFDQGEPMPDMDDMGGGEEPQMGGDEPWGDEEKFDAGVEADEESDPKNYIQQLSGKLAQSLRDYDSQNETDLDLEKFALNSVISATHTGKMHPDEQGEIIEKIKTAGTDEYETSDEEDGKEDDDEDDMSMDMAEPTGAMPTNPASQGAPGGMGESFQRKEVFADPKLGVPDEESNFHPLQKEGCDNDLACFDDFIFNEEEEGNNFDAKNLDVMNKKDSFVGSAIDSSIKRMIQDYLNTQNGFQKEEEMTEPTTKPETKPTTEPSTKPRPSRRDAPYRIHEQPGVNPNPKAKK